MIAVSAAGLAIGVASIPLWIVLASVAIAPPILAVRFWQVPPETLSESIREARR